MRRRRFPDIDFLFDYGMKVPFGYNQQGIPIYHGQPSTHLGHSQNPIHLTTFNLVPPPINHSSYPPHHSYYREGSNPMPTYQSPGPPLIQKTRDHIPVAILVQKEDFKVKEESIKEERIEGDEISSPTTKIMKDEATDANIFDEKKILSRVQASLDAFMDDIEKNLNNDIEGMSDVDFNDHDLINGFNILKKSLLKRVDVLSGSYKEDDISVVLSKALHSIQQIYQERSKYKQKWYQNSIIQIQNKSAAMRREIEADNEVKVEKRLAEMRKECLDYQEKFLKLKTLSEALDGENQSLRIQLESSKELHKQTVHLESMKLKSEADRRIAELEQQLNLANMKAISDATMAEAQKRGEIDSLNADHNRKTKQVIEEMQQVIHNMQAERDRMCLDKSSIERVIKDSYQTKFTQLRQAHEDALNDIRSKAERLTSEHNKYVSNMRTEHEASLKEASERALSSVKESTVAELQREIESLRSKHRIDIDSLVIEHEKKMVDATNQIRKLSIEVEASKLTINTLQKDIKASNLRDLSFTLPSLEESSTVEGEGATRVGHSKLDSLLSEKEKDITELKKVIGQLEGELIRAKNPNSDRRLISIGASSGSMTKSVSVQTNIDLSGGGNIHPLDYRACTRCGMNDLSSPSSCTFHPFLVQGSGPFVYGPEWHACRSHNHLPSQRGCYTRGEHHYAAHLPFVRKERNMLLSDGGDDSTSILLRSTGTSAYDRDDEPRAIPPPVPSVIAEEKKSNSAALRGGPVREKEGTTRYQMLLDEYINKGKKKGVGGGKV
jgi:hypothetical protein